MKSWQLLILVVVICISCIAANVDAAMVTISIDNDRATVPLLEVPKPQGTGNLFIIGESEEDPFIFETDNGRVILAGMLDPDPSIFFGGAAFDFGAPSIFGLTFILPLAPPFPNPSQVFDSFSGSVTNGPPPQPDGGVTVTALAPLAGVPVDADGVTEIQVYTLSDDGGATWKNVGLDLGPTTFVPLAAGGSGLYGSYNEGYIATIPGGPWTHMRADISFMLSGGGDIFTFSGAKVLVPEPGTVVLALFALATICFCRRSAIR